jgi:hypothetical protein
VRKQIEASPELVEERRKQVKDLAAQVPEGEGWLLDPATYLQIEDAVAEMEELNTANFAADSGALEGEWKVIFSTGSGLNAGIFGLINGEARQIIKTQGRELTMRSSFLLGFLQFEWRTSWKSTGQQTMVIGREDWYPIILGLKITLISASIAGTVNWKCTYTDEKMRILRASKTNINKGQSSDIFVLERV